MLVSKVVVDTDGKDTILCSLVMRKSSPLFKAVLNVTYLIPSTDSSTQDVTATLGTLLTVMPSCVCATTKLLSSTIVGSIAKLVVLASPVNRRL